MAADEGKRFEWRALREREEERRGFLNQFKEKIGKKVKRETPKEFLRFVIRKPETSVSEIMKELNVDKLEVLKLVKFYESKDLIAIDDPLSPDPNISATSKLREFVRKKIQSKETGPGAVKEGVGKQLKKAEVADKPEDERKKRLEVERKLKSVEKKIRDETGDKPELENLRDQLIAEKERRDKAEDLLRHEQELSTKKQEEMKEKDVTIGKLEGELEKQRRQMADAEEEMTLFFEEEGTSDAGGDSETLKRLKKKLLDEKKELDGREEKLKAEAREILEESRHLEEVFRRESEELRKREQELRKLVEAESAKISEAEFGGAAGQPTPEAGLLGDDSGKDEPSGAALPEPEKADISEAVVEETSKQTVTETQPPEDNILKDDDDGMISSFLEEASKPVKKAPPKKDEPKQSPAPAIKTKAGDVNATRNLQAEKIRLDEIREKTILEGEERKRLEEDRLREELKRQTMRQEKGPNDLLKLVARSGSMSVKDAAKELRVETRKVEEWVKKLQEQNLIDVRKKILGGPQLSISQGAAKKIRTKREDEEISQIKDELKKMREEK
ncbi:MAG: hypothetical protein V1921_07290 [Candidatus Altiarchaeota archaeon]